MVDDGSGRRSGPPPPTRQGRRLRFQTTRRPPGPENPAREIGLAEAQLSSPGAAVGDALEIDLPSDTLGRIAAQAAKQVIFQKIRDAEREQILSDFLARDESLVTGTVKRIERGSVIALPGYFEPAMWLRFKELVDLDIWAFYLPAAWVFIQWRSPAEKKKIMRAFADAFAATGYINPKKLWGKVIEDRGSQITFSALGDGVG